MKIYVDPNEIKESEPKTKEEFEKELFDKIMGVCVLERRLKVFGCCSNKTETKSDR